MPGDADPSMAIEEVVRAFGLGIREQAEELLLRSVAQAPIGPAPVSGTGTAAHPPGQLKESGHLERFGDNEWAVVFSTAYAKKQHEAQQYKHPQGGKAKYLEDPLKEMLPTMALEISDDVRRALMTPGPDIRRALPGGNVLASTARGAGGRFARVGAPGSVTRTEIWRGGGGRVG